MTSENERLLALLRDKKITQDEFTLLSKAIEKKTFFASRWFTYFINPYQKIAGFNALIIGLALILIISYLGSIAKIYFPGTLSILNASFVKNPKIAVSFFFLLYQNIVIWLVLTALFILAAKIFQQKRIRIIDFFGTVALARFPYLVLTSFLAIMRIVKPNFMDVGMEHGVQVQLSMLALLFSTVVIICAIWHITTYFYALKEASGLNGKKLWFSFIVCIVVGEIISNFVTMIPVYKSEK